MSRHRLEMKLRPVAEAYGLKLRLVKPCPSVYNDNAAFRASTNRGSLLIKPFLGSRARLMHIAANLEQLYRSGFRHMPGWLQARSGERWTRIDRNLYYVSEWIDGIRLDELTDLARQKAAFRLLGQVMAELHRQAQYSPRASTSRILEDIRMFKGKHRLFTRDLAIAEKLGTSQAAWFQSEGKLCLELADKAFRSLRKPDVVRKLREERPCFIHGDITLPNIIWNDERLYLIDWDRARIGFSYMELAKTLANTSEFDVTRMEALLKGYEEVRPLQPVERLIVGSLFRLPREVWMTASKMKRHQYPPLFKIVERSWQRRLAAIAWLDDWAIAR